ncbi:hypothetical protein FRB96_008192 [Tulasnella sp. 330]|nr:hypothetical protein FRB96_008192 [Tulasnella sp. 330]
MDMVAEPTTLPMVVAIQDIAVYIQGRQITTMISVATVFVILYDIIATLDREVYYVWNTRFCPANVIFLFNRYVPLFYLIFNLYASFVENACKLDLFVFSPPDLELRLHNSCLYSVLVPCFLNLFIVNAMTSVIAVRTWIIFERSRLALSIIIIGSIAIYLPAYVLFFLNFGLTAYDISIQQAITQVKGASTTTIPDSYRGNMWVLDQCYVPLTPSFFGLVLSAALIFESFLFSAMVWTFFKREPRSRIADAFYRDGMFYYLCMFVALLSAAIACFQGPLVRAIVPSYYYVGVKSIVTSHIAIRLRSYFSEGDAVVDGRRSRYSGASSARDTGAVSTDIRFTAGLAIAMTGSRLGEGHAEDDEIPRTLSEEELEDDAFEREMAIGVSLSPGKFGP